MAHAAISASLKGIPTLATPSTAIGAQLVCRKRKRASAPRWLRPVGATMDLATPTLTSSTGEIVPRRNVWWHACLRKARWDVGVVPEVYRPPGIAAVRSAFPLRRSRSVTCILSN